jgi:hypothetical protein
MLKYEPENQCLQVELQEYNCKEISSFGTRLQTKEVTKLKFNLPFDWEKLDAVSYSSNKGKLMELGYIEEHSIENYKNPIIERFANKSLSNPRFSKREEEKILLRMHLDNAHFKNGRVEFGGNVELKGRKIELLFSVNNIHILEKFDFVKLWFSKKIGVNKWSVNLMVVWIDNEFTIENATSEDIDKITPELIEGIKYDRTVNLLNNPSIEDSTQELFSIDEIFSQIDTEKKEKNTFEQSEKDILKILLSKKGRNRKQLEYLSEEKQSLEYSLKFTLNPHFGFLFTVEGNENNHFVWELLETHATYIWSMNKSIYNIEKQFKQVENEISIITKFGREKYRKNFQRDQELTFEHINHDGIVMRQEKHFIEWKNKLDKYLES